MRWTIALCASLLSVNAGAQWVQFEACGFDVPHPNAEISKEQTIVAPTIGPRWIWVPSISAVTGLTEKQLQPGGVTCVGLLIGGKRSMVVGTLEEVMRKLREAK